MDKFLETRTSLKLHHDGISSLLCAASQVCILRGYIPERTPLSWVLTRELSAQAWGLHMGLFVPW